MKRYLVKTPKLVQWLFPRRVWAFSRKLPAVYLTFDDGPIPEVTPWVLDLLKKYNAKATFFCIGDNVRKHPEIFQRIISEGHAVGNHTYHHLNGSKTKFDTYIRDVISCEKQLKEQARITSDERRILKKSRDSRTSQFINRTLLFRPPYGKLTQKQARKVSEKGYKIIMWDVLSADFDMSITKEICLKNVLDTIQKGSIVVFHDSLKAEKNLRFVLPKVLNCVAEKKWEFTTLWAQQGEP